MDKKAEVKSKEARSRFQITAIIITFVVVALACFFGIQIFNRTGLFKEPGKIVFDPTVTESVRDFIEESVGEITLENDVNISTHTATTRTDNENSLLYNLLLPTTDFYDPRISVTEEEAKSTNLISFWDLSFSKKLLAIDNHYFLDDFNSGAFFEYIDLSSANPEDAKHVSDLISAQLAKLPSSSEVLTFAQTGVTALSRGMTQKLNEIGDAKLFATNIASLLSSFDLTHTSNESSFSKSAHSKNICSDPRMIDVLTAIGLDIVELTGNHNQDCGDEDAKSTIDQYHSLGMLTFGGGKTAADAAQPLEISQKNTKITLLGYNYSTGGYTTDATPGANHYTEEKAKSDITNAKARGDFVIVDVQFYECNNYVNTSEDTTCDKANSSAGDQIGFFRHLIDLGADVVVGTSAHQPQTFELYGNGAIYYGLGNLFFDQSWWPGTTRSLILAHYFYNNQLLQTRIIPTVYDDTYQTKPMDNENATAFLKRLIEARPNS